ncbi:MAG: substrate-binding domain-containing protein, partial [Aestuariivirga sp.]
ARRLLEQSKVPVIETFELTRNPIDHNIGLSQSRAGCAATKFLIKNYRRKIGFILGHLDVRAAARLRGYKQAMAEADLSTEGLITTKPEYSHIALGADIMSELVSNGSVPEALFCTDDNLALGALMTCRRLGLRVPDDIAILGFHDLEFSAYSSPSLSSVATHRREIGKLAAETAIRLIAHGTNNSRKQEDLGYEIVSRQTTGSITP